MSALRNASNDHARSVSGESDPPIYDTTINEERRFTAPPAYSELAADNETSVDAQAVEEQKSSAPGRLHSSSASTAPTPNTSGALEDPETAPPATLTGSENMYLASTIRCSILPSRPAVWLLKHTNLSLSLLAAAVLLKEGLITSNDLELNAPSDTTMREPNNPVSGVVVGTYDAVADILRSLASGPAEAGRYVAEKHTKQGAEDCDRIDPPTEDLQHRASGPTLDHKSNTVKHFALGTGIGTGRIVGASLKAPMSITHGMTRGFHNLPKVYGDNVREYAVTDLKSGLEVSAKSFRDGISDGLKDFFVQPLIGADKEGGKGFIKGIAKGMGSLVCKPSAGACGLVSYGLVGAYKQVKASSAKASEGDAVEPGAIRILELGDAEYEMASEQTRVEVVRRWCQLRRETENGW